MKFGPITISRNAGMAPPPRQTTTPDYREIGAPGTQIFGGWMTSQDYNPDLAAPGSYDVYDRMRLGDGQVGAALAVIKLPILRAHWEVEAASDSAQDKMIAEFIETDLRGMTTSFAATLRQIMLYLDYGSMPFEEVWEIRDDNLIHLRKLSPRNPRTVIRWMTDETGGFAGIQQSAFKASGYEVVTIPAEKMVLFVNEQEGANFRGISVLRRAYKHWYYKDGMYKIDAIANEKRTVGVDIGTIKPGAGDKDKVKAALESALMTFHAHEKNYFVEDEENYTYRLETGGARGNANAIMASIEHHDLHILRSVIAEFAAMGSGSTGSLAMHRDKTGFFLMALEATSDNIAETTSSYLLKRWVDYNWKVKEYPRMKYSRLDTRDTTSIAEAVNKLMSVQALTPSPDTEAELRVLMDLPELEIEPPQLVPTKVSAPSPEAVPPPPEQADQTPAKIAAAIRPIQERQLARLQTELAAGKAAESIERLPYRREVAAAIADVLVDDPQAKTKAQALANILADRLKMDVALTECEAIGRGLAAVA